MNNGTFMSPIPREYSTYSDQEKIEKTEEYYFRMDKLYQRIDTTEGEYIHRINLLLQSGVTHKELLEVLREKEAQVLCHYSYMFYVMEFLCNVTEIEEKFNENVSLQNISSMEDAVRLHQKCVFLTRRFEMNWEPDDELLSLLKVQQSSYFLVAELICKEWISRKVHTGSRISWYLHENGLKREAILFLMWLEHRLPYSDKKIVFFVTTLLDMGEYKLAYDILLKHQKPDEDTAKLINVLREML